MARPIPRPLYYEQLGATGMPTIFLHSAPDDHRLWMHQTAHFAAWHRCLAVEVPAAYDAHRIRFLSRRGLYPGPAAESAR